MTQIVGWAQGWFTKANNYPAFLHNAVLSRPRNFRFIQRIRGKKETAGNLMPDFVSSSRISMAGGLYVTLDTIWGG